MGLLKVAADNRDERSWAHRMRVRRFKLFRNLLQDSGRQFRVLDVGGTPRYWERMGMQVPRGCEIVLLNLRSQPGALPAGMTWMEGDGTDLSSIRDREFTICFSNSVIEHLGSFEQQMRMAKEIQRVADHHYVQTPNYWFFLEPHFLLPGIHWCPRGLQAAVVHRLRPGWYGKNVASREQAVAVTESLRLLDRAEMRQLFPRSQLIVERWLGLAKSFVVIGHHPDVASSS